MKILHFVLFLFATTMSICTFCLCCFPVKIKPIQDKAFVMNKKYLDPVYMRQLAELEKCCIDLDLFYLNDVELNTALWTEQAATSIYHTLSPKERHEFEMLDYKKCFEGIAELNAKKFACETFEIALGEEDMLLKYAIEEYNACIKSKANIDGKGITFDMPQIGPVDL